MHDADECKEEDGKGAEQKEPEREATGIEVSNGEGKASLSGIIIPLIGVAVQVMAAAEVVITGENSVLMLILGDWEL